MVNRYSLILLGLLWGASLFAQGGNSFIKPEQENIRQTPNGDRIGIALGGTQVEVLDKKSNWVKVQLTGWIWANSLTSDSTHIEGFTIRASHILVNTEEEANQIIKRLKQGENFDELAKQYSVHNESRLKGGDLGEFKRGDFSLPEFENTVFQLKKGEYSGIIRTTFGYHIIKRTK